MVGLDAGVEFYFVGAIADVFGKLNFSGQNTRRVVKVKICYETEVLRGAYVLTASIQLLILLWFVCVCLLVVCVLLCRVWVFLCARPRVC